MSEEQPPEGHKHSLQISPAERGIGFGMAIGVLVVFIVLVLYPRSMDGTTQAIVRFLAATFAGIAGYLFVGNLGLEAKIPWNKSQIRATGTFAAFIIVLLLFFYGIPTSSEKGNQKSHSESSSSKPTTPEPMISGEWVGSYTCSLGITGVTVTIDQTGSKVTAEFSLYPLPENPGVPRGVSLYEGIFTSNTRYMGLAEGKWVEKPDDGWKAFAFHGQFDQNLQMFSGEMDGYRCTTIHLTRKVTSRI